MMTASRPQAVLTVALATLYVLIAFLLVYLLAGPANAGKPCKKNCEPDPDTSVDRIGGCFTFDAGNPIGSNGTLAYCDGDQSSYYNGDPISMQIAMNCKFNYVNLFVGGGDPWVEVVVPGDPIETGITSCESVPLPVEIAKTSDFFGYAAGSDLDCEEPSGLLDWGFDQLLRSDTSQQGAALNVCELRPGQGSIVTSLRFQTNLHHRTSCKGRKCGTTFEALDINYGEGTACGDADPVEISCIMDDENGCTQWRVETVDADGSNSVDGCLANGSGASAVLMELPFGGHFCRGGDPCP